MTSNSTPQRFLKIALRVHAIYFAGYALFFEFLPTQALHYLGMTVPADLLGGIATKVAAGGLLTCAVFFWYGSREATVPKVVIIAALIQTIYNLYHDIIGGLQFRISTSLQHGVVFVDMILIGILCIVYLTTWLKLNSEDDA